MNLATTERETMARRVTLDAMIPREDFALEEEELVLEILFGDFPIRNLASDSPIVKLLRKPEFQRETNHWNPDQVATFVASFVDNEVIPSLILWKSKSFIFVIDGGHRLSALRAWMDDDYGFGAHSLAFFGGEISEEQKRIDKFTRTLVEKKVGRFTTLRDLVGSTTASEPHKSRANRLFTRTIPVQWIQGNPGLAETSFYKINSQGTPLDETEELLIRNRRKPIAIAARAILRGGSGHKYWSAFSEAQKAKVQERAAKFYDLLFEPEINEPLKTLDVPLGGYSSPIEALALLVEFLSLSGTRGPKPKTIAEYDDDSDGEATLDVIDKSWEITNRLTGNDAASLGLHPGVYFYNEKGKYSRFLFLGMTQLITDKIRNNDSGFFKKFTKARAALETFLIENKSLIGVILQNLGRKQRIPKMRDLLMFLVSEGNNGNALKPEDAIKYLGLRSRIFDVVSAKSATDFSDEAKSTIYIQKALDSALICPICKGKLDPKKSVSYDHKTPVRDGGTGDPQNGDLVHPYCNTAIKN